MCCCCPPAISALFCLWCQSGCSKGSVAGALTFFPPEPPLYAFEKHDKDGNIVVDDDDYSDEEDEENNSNPAEGETGNPNEAAANESSANSNRTGTGKEGQTKEKMQSPAQQLVERASGLRKRAKRRNARDARDAERGIKYKLLLDPRLAIPPYEDENVSCVKIPAANGIYVAAIVYKISIDNSAYQNKSRDQRKKRNSSKYQDNLSSQLSNEAIATSPLNSSRRSSDSAANDKKEKGKIIPKTIIYSHGNATDIGAMFPLQAILAHSLDCNVVMYDYSGYGESGGMALENNTYRDIEAVYAYVLKNLACNDPGNIILYGQSVGSGPCCHLAGREEYSKIGGMILHSPFTSGMRVLTPSRLLACLDIYPNIDRIKRVKCPVMLIHGRLDEEVEISHGLQLHNAVPQHLQRDPWWVNDRGHNDITEGPGKLAEYVRRLRDYMDSL